MKQGKSKVSPKARTTPVNKAGFVRRASVGLCTPGSWAFMKRYNLPPMVVVNCPQCQELGLLSDHKVVADGSVSPSMDCQNDDCTYHTFIRLYGWDYGVLDNRGEVTRMGELDNLKQQKREWDLWKDLIVMLKDTGAITEEDGKSKESARDTAGQRLMAGIRAWGDSLVELRGVRPPVPDPVMLGIVTQIVPGVVMRGAANGDEFPEIVQTARALAEEILKQCSP